jgi:hypothetical protein
MERTVVQTDFEPAEYSMLAATARKKGLTIKEALREAVLRWNKIESGINPKNTVFTAGLTRKPLRTRRVRLVSRKRKLPNSLFGAAKGSKPYSHPPEAEHAL